MSSPAPKKACVIGYPIKHSRSPVIHNYWLKKYGIEGSYTAEEVHPDNLKLFLTSLKKAGYVGCNITIPHKEEALKYVDEVQDSFRDLGAINTVAVTLSGKLRGTNTDIEGFVRNIVQTGFKLSGKTAYVVGAGGAARAVVAALMLYKCKKIFITNRTHDRLKNLAENMKKLANHGLSAELNLVGWEDREAPLERCDLLVNTTSQGMEGQLPLDLSLKRLKDGALVNDLIYTPLETPLLAEAIRRNHRTVDGLGMLLHQAAPSFEMWFGGIPEVTPELREIVLADIKAKSAA